jgi:hypothetical protein
MPYKFNPFSGYLDYTASNTAGSINTINTDSGTASPAANEITITGGSGINTSGAGSTVTINMDIPLGVSDGGTGNVSFTHGAILVGDTTNPIDEVGPLTDGQLLIGDTAGILPAAASLTAPAAGITITGGAGTITFALADGLAALEALPGNGIVAQTGGDTFANRTITGTTDYIDVTNGDGVSGNPTISLTSQFQSTGKSAWNGSLIETSSVTITSDGATITCSVEKNGGGDLTVVFSDGYYNWDTSPADTVTLTAGTDTSPQFNYVYFLQSTKTLTASTAGWPATEHAPIAVVFCQSAATLQTKGPYFQQNWTDHIIGDNNEGHIDHINYWIRAQRATWESGVSQTFTISGSSPENVTMETTSGVVLQLHEQTFPAFSNPHDYYVVNDSGTPYNIVTDLNALLTDSTGGSMVNKYFALVLWGSASQTGSGNSKIYVNLPGGSYNNQTDLTEDVSGYSNFTIPNDFKSTGFLIAEWKLRHQSAGGGNWTSVEEIDLRGLEPSQAAGGSPAVFTEFDDALFRIFDDADDTKKIAFQASPITTATTRTLTMVDADLDLATVSNSFPTDSGTAAPTANALTISGGTGVNTSGSSTTVTINIDSPVTVANGGTGKSTLTPINGLVIANSTSPVGVTNAATDGQVMLGATLGAPAFASLTSTDSSISFTGGTNTLDIEINGPVSVANGGTGASTLTGVLTGNGTSAVTAAAVTQYGVLVGDASNGVTSTAVGTATHVLTSNGAGSAPTFQAAAGGGGGAWEYVSTTTASSDATIEFTSLTGVAYMFVFHAMMPSAGTGPNFISEFSDDGGSTWVSADCQYSGVQCELTSLTGVGTVTASTGALGWGIDNSTGSYGITGTGKFYNLNNASYPLCWNAETEYQDSAGDHKHWSVGGISADDANGGSTLDIDSIRFSFSSGNISTGTIYTYKLVTS